MVLLCFPGCTNVIIEDHYRRDISLIPISWCLQQDEMVQKKLSSEGRLLARMKVPWEVAEASIETVQPSEDDLCKVFSRWGCSEGLYNVKGHRHHKDMKTKRSLSYSDSILQKVNISPDFSSFTLTNQKKGMGRERSISCPLAPRTNLTRRRKNTDFDSIIRDISDDSLYLRFKNRNSSSSTRIDTNNNATTGSISNSSSPPVSLTSNSSGELKKICKAEDDIWTDISLESITYDNTTEQTKGKTIVDDRSSEQHENCPNLTYNEQTDDKTTVTDELNDSLQSLVILPEEKEEYWKFTQDVYRTLTGDDEAMSSLSQPNSCYDIGSSIWNDLNESNSSLWESNDKKYMGDSSKDQINSVWSSSNDNQSLNVQNDDSISPDDKAKLIDELLQDIYPKSFENSPTSRRKSEWNFDQIRGKERKKLVRFHSESGGFLLDIRILPEEIMPKHSLFDKEELETKCNWELTCLIEELRSDILNCGKRLVGELQTREELAIKKQESCDVVTAYLQASSEKRSEDTQMKFSVEPGPGDTGFTEWATAMKMVARLPEGVPQHFRKTLWLTLAEKNLSSRGISWQQTERALFSESSNPGDEELSVQIVKDLHRTGCSLFCGVSGQHNQAVLKRVLLAFARWNKNVGYCQGLNMLAALILQVMQGSQTSTVKVMIYLIEGVLPDSYFGQSLRGLSVDMAVFRDLLRLKLPQLSKHLDQLQHESKESGTSYEPPLMDVFTMQWFLTIFSNCLPQATVLRVWDLLFLEGNEVLLKTALAIWQYFSERIMAVKSADEFYSSMAIYTREMLELGLMDPNCLIKAIDTLSIPEVAELREKYVYNITPWTVATVAKKGLRFLYDPYDSDDDHQNNWSDSGDRSDNSSKHRDSKITPFSNHPDREKIALDISVLKKQYMKLRERQRQAHIIFTAACSSDSLGTNSSPALNHLLLGKSALLSMKGRRIEGTIPPPMNKNKVEISGETLHWRDAADSRQSRARRKNGRVNKVTYQANDEMHMTRSRSISSSSSGSSSSSTELCDDSSDERSGDELPNDSTIAESLPNEEKQDDKNETIIASAISSNTLDNIDSNATIDAAGDDDVLTDCSDKDRLPDNEIEDGDNQDNDEGGGGVKRRNSERALMQILRENSEILRRIQSQSAIKTITEMAPEEEQREKEDLIRELKLEVYRNSIRSLDRVMHEPDDIAEIRKKYSINKQWSLDSSATTKKSLPDNSDKTKSFDLTTTIPDSTITSSPPHGKISPGNLSPSKPFSPFPIRSPRKKSQLGVQLGLYSPDSPHR